MTTRILLAVTGGIAAYKSAELVRLLSKQGFDVRVVMSQTACQFVSPLTFQALSGHAVCTELLETDADNAMGHISLARWADVFLIAPATANSLAKCSHGLADDLVSTLYLSTTCPIYMAPAMNQAMWHKAITQQNVQRLIEQGVNFIGPESGSQACGETGFGRMSEPETICTILTNWLNQSDSQPSENYSALTSNSVCHATESVLITETEVMDTVFITQAENKTQTTVDNRVAASNAAVLSGKKILISAGPTREALDPVRYISNRSSGKMGYALANAALQAGADVTLVSGPVALTPPDCVNFIAIESAEQMYREILTRASQYDVYIGAAAIADYSPVNVQVEKIKKQSGTLILTLKKTKDVLGDVAQLINGPFTVGFAAETDDLEYYAKDKLTRKKIDMIAANWVGKEYGGFESDHNELQVFWPTGHKTLTMADKSTIAVQLINLIAERLNAKNTT